MENTVHAAAVKQALEVLEKAYDFEKNPSTAAKRRLRELHMDLPEHKQLNDKLKAQLTTILTVIPTADQPRVIEEYISSVEGAKKTLRERENSKEKQAKVRYSTTGISPEKFQVKPGEKDIFRH